MPFTDTTQTIQSVLTDQGRDLLARAVLGQLSFQLSGFQAGRGGYPIGNPVHVDPVVAADTGLIDQIFPLGGGVAPLAAIEAPYHNVTSAVCRLGRADALFGIGEVGLYVRVTRTGTFATYQHVVGVTNGLMFTAKASGVAGNAAQITLLGAGANQVLSVTTVGSSVVVQLATDGAAVITSTIAHVANAIRTDPSANAIMACAAYGTTTTLCTALAIQSLAGGADPVLPYTVGTDYLVALAHMPLAGKTDKTVMVFRFVISV